MASVKSSLLPNTALFKLYIFETIICFFKGLGNQYFDIFHTNFLLIARECKQPDRRLLEHEIFAKPGDHLIGIAMTPDRMQFP